jgi:hypothetical protein
LLARQQLLQRATSTLPKAIERVGGLQTQYAPAGYIALRTRLDGFERDDLTRALERKRVVQAWLMRSTIHMATARDFWLFTEAIREERRRLFLRAWKGSAREFAGPARKVERLLADGPKRRGELTKSLGLDARTWYGVMLWLDLVRVPPFGTWARPRADLFALASDWLGDPPSIARDEAVEHLVGRYLAAFGPASSADAASFTGLPPREVSSVLGRLGVRRFADERGGELFDVARAPLPDPETPAPVRFLPAWDATLLVHARRTQILPERHRSRVFSTKTPHSIHTFLVDGRVAGAWRPERGHVVLEPFEPLPKATRVEIDEEAEHMAGLFTDN